MDEKHPSRRIAPAFFTAKRLDGATSTTSSASTTFCGAADKFDTVKRR